MNEVITLLFANSWEMVDEKTGEKREGVTLEYVLGDSLKPTLNSDGSKGLRHIKESLPIACINMVQAVPAVYLASYGMSVVKGKPIMKVSEIKFQHEIGVAK